MPPVYRILLVEDNPDDAEIIRYSLNKADYTFTLRRVETEQQFLEALTGVLPDIVLSDYHLPQFNGKRALELLLASRPDIPFVLVSGAVGDEIAVEMLRNGCVDYVLKDKLARLTSAVERAILEAKSKKEKEVMLESLKESEMRFRRIADNSPMLIWMSDAAKETVYINATYQAFTGRTLDEEKEGGWLNAIHADDRERCGNAFDAAYAARARFVCEYRFRYHDGSYRWVYDTGVPNYLQNGDFIGYIGSCVDITDRKVSEQQLVESEHKFRSLFNNHSAVKMLIDPETGSIVDANQSAAEYYGWSHKELTSRTIFDINTNPEQQVRNVMQGVLQNNKKHFHARHRLSDGSFRDVDIYSSGVSVSSRRLLYSIIHDITDKVRSEEQLRLNSAALDSAKNAIMISDIAGTIIWANRAFCSLTGYTFDEAVGKNPRDLVRSGMHDDQYFKELWSTILAGRVWQGELINRRKDGSVYYEEQTITPIITAEGRITHFIAIKQDITQRKAMEETLRSTTEMLDKFFHQSLDACYFMKFEHPFRWAEGTNKLAVLTEMYETARIVKVNDALLQQFHISAESVAAMNPRMIFDGDFGKVQTLFTQVFDSGATYYSTTMRRDDDKSEIVVEGNAVCIYDDQQRITGFFGIQRDVTQNVKEKETLQRNQERYKKFFEEDMTGDFIVKPDGTVVMCNPSFARMFGFPTIETVLKETADALYPDPEEKNVLMAKLEKETKVEHHALRAKRQNGEEFTALMTAIAHFNTHGEIDEIVGYITDDTRRQEMENQMIQAQKMESIGELASGVAHDFNNILNNILGFSQQLLKYHTDPVRVLRYADTIGRSAVRGTEIASKLLSFARQRKTDTAVLSLTDIVKDVLQMCHDTFMHSINVHASIDPLLWKVQGERSGLYQMLLNICMNARDALQDDPQPGFRGTLNIDVRNQSQPNPDLHWFRNSAPTQFIEIIISDNGPGISHQHIEKIFDPFFSTKKQNAQKGTGLGLTVVYNIVKSHQGAIQVKSEPGKGTAFHIYLPAVEYSASPTDGNDLSIYHSKNNELVLVVDDEEGMRELGRELLEDSHYRVLTASNGAEAVELVRQRGEEIALVILDLVMPGMDGGQAFLQIRQIKPEQKVFFCSGYVTDSLITNMLSEENLGALQKPFLPDQFVKFVYKTLYGTPVLRDGAGE
jgi:PAS domain S-box-containing protein